MKYFSTEYYEALRAVMMNIVVVDHLKSMSTFKSAINCILNDNMEMEITSHNLIGYLPISQDY